MGSGIRAGSVIGVLWGTPVTGFSLLRQVSLLSAATLKFSPTFPAFLLPFLQPWMRLCPIKPNKSAVELNRGRQRASFQQELHHGQASKKV